VGMYVPSAFCWNLLSFVIAVVTVSLKMFSYGGGRAGLSLVR